MLLITTAGVRYVTHIQESPGMMILVTTTSVRHVIHIQGSIVLLVTTTAAIHIQGQVISFIRPVITATVQCMPALGL
ncbi:hypothetical protein CesoFtcFv8_016837 [Champsocephalus esox]|uniref:Uncharacterized protein n=1 Tax=Champsocephalus esox TaxID=159716 RepID=A0AAN8BJ21_9TELE|nr:hypothetical protein CesoFtcFv8_016837 [Champsocephalus esox]